MGVRLMSRGGEYRLRDGVDGPMRIVGPNAAVEFVALRPEAFVNDSCVFVVIDDEPDAAPQEAPTIEAAMSRRRRGRRV